MASAPFAPLSGRRTLTVRQSSAVAKSVGNCQASMNPRYTRKNMHLRTGWAHNAPYSDASNAVVLNEKSVAEENRSADPNGMPERNG